jgi:hypothetical protein
MDGAGAAGTFAEHAQGISRGQGGNYPRNPLFFRPFRANLKILLNVAFTLPFFS